MSSHPLALEVGRLLTKLRADWPLVQAVTNYVSMDVAANALLAVGASPAMVSAIEEVEDFLVLADALVINIGTLSREWIESMELAAAAATRLGKPWTLDPVGVGATPYRDRTTARLLEFSPTVVRGNASEILAAAYVAGVSETVARPKGVESAHAGAAAHDAAKALAQAQRCIVAATGELDFITDGERAVEIANGSALMPKVTGLGCSLSAIVSAFLAVTPDAFAATVAAVGVFGVAGEIAAETAVGPGDFRVALINALYKVGEADIVARLKVS